MSVKCLSKILKKFALDDITQDEIGYCCFTPGYDSADKGGVS
ncbi:MAG: hypothetical protein V5A88_04645 [Candidatus Thermoplasmatota archaeon]